MIEKKDDDDDQVNKDADQGTSEEEPEEKYQTERSKKYALESDISEPDERYQRDKKVLFKSTKNLTKGDDIVHTDNYQEKITKNWRKRIREKKEKG